VVTLVADDIRIELGILSEAEVAALNSIYLVIGQLPIATYDLIGQCVDVGESAGDLGDQPSASCALHNWIVNGVISLPYVVVTAVMLFALVAAALERLDGSLPSGLVFLAGCTVLSARALTRGVVASPAGLRVRRVFRTREIAWCDIDRFVVRVDAHPDQMTWYSCVVEGSGWESDRDLPIASGSPEKAARFVARLNAALAQHRPPA